MQYDSESYKHKVQNARNEREQQQCVFDRIEQRNKRGLSDKMQRAGLDVGGQRGRGGFRESDLLRGQTISHESP